MSANTGKLNLSALDFDSIKNNLITYLQSQNVIQDYAYTGSAMNQFLNILAYNTHYLSFYLNMACNEMFLDTAVLRENIVSHAKLLSYVPRSATSAQAVVNVVITQSNTNPVSVLTMPAFTAFSSEVLNGVSYNFVTVDTVTALNVNNTFTFTGIMIHEGQPVSKSFIADNTINPSQLFDLGDSQLDTSTLTVVVQDSATITTQKTFTLSEHATEVDGKTNIYYLNVGQNGNYQIYFGDGILGTALEDGNIIIVSYINTSGAPANGLDTFQLQSPLLSGSTSNVTAQFPSSSGSPVESGQSVQFSAPKSYLAQNRTVTVPDYIALINKKYPFFQAITVWGGEDNVPPIYGSVFISAKPLGGFVVTESQQQFLINQVLTPIGILTVTPVFVQPDYNYLNFFTTVYYNQTQTTLTAAQLQSTVANSIQAWANTNLNQFNTQFYFSQLLRSIDNTDPSIDGSTATVYLEKRISPILNSSLTYTLNYGTQLRVGVGSDRLFSSPTYTDVDSTGVERQCYLEETPESSSGIDVINIIQSGIGYTNAPTLSIIGDGAGANAFVTIVNGQIAQVTIDKPGTGYTTATVTVTGGNGRGCVLQALAQGATGTLRSYFFSNNNIKTVLNPTQGQIDYINGIITLTNFKPSNVANPQQVLSIHIEPDNDNFGSNLNRIMTLDPSDPAAVSITLINESKE